MLSKSRGQVLRIATILHMLFSIDSEQGPLNNEVSDMAVKAAVNFVQTACQQTAFIAGKGLIKEEVQGYKAGIYDTYMHQYIPLIKLASEFTICTIVDFAESAPISQDMETAGFCLTLPGRTLYLTPLLALKKFRKKGNKDGAVRAFYCLQEEGLGKVLEVGGTKGTSSVSILLYVLLCVCACL